MSRLLLCTWIVTAAAFVFGQETPPAETEQITVIKDTGGEWEDAKQPELDAVEQAIVQRTNAFRKENKRKPVSANEELTQAAQSFAEFMARTGKYGHTADGQKPADRVKEAGYAFCIVRENIAYAFRTKGFSTEELTDQFVTGWEQSPGHRRNMLAQWITGTGVGVAKSEETDAYFAVQVFGRPESAAVAFEIVNESELTVRYRFSGREFAVEPRVIRTHKACAPEEIVFLPLAQKDAASDPVHSVARVIPASGDKIVVTPAESGGYRVAVKHEEAPTKTPVTDAGR
jgi:uncharacterized protein YkwD